MKIDELATRAWVVVRVPGLGHAAENADRIALEHGIGERFVSAVGVAALPCRPPGPVRCSAVLLAPSTAPRLDQLGAACDIADAHAITSAQ